MKPVKLRRFRAPGDVADAAIGRVLAILTVALVAGLPTTPQAQEPSRIVNSETGDDEISSTALAPAEAHQIEEKLVTAYGDGAVLRILDFLTGHVEEVELAAGQRATRGFLTVELAECRYPQVSPNSDAFARIVISDRRYLEPRFEGWMVASSPALSALDHPRYDVWVIRCRLSDHASEPRGDSGDDRETADIVMQTAGPKTDSAVTAIGHRNGNGSGDD